MTRPAAVLLSLMLALPALANADASGVESTKAEHDAPRKPRLKFKSRGPICLCGSGLSEKDIQQAARRDAERPSETQSTRSEK